MGRHGQWGEEPIRPALLHRVVVLRFLYLKIWTASVQSWSLSLVAPSRSFT
jgi:hypothetical protein